MLMKNDSLRSDCKTFFKVFAVAATIWAVWILIEFFIHFSERLADAEERAASVYIPYRSDWLCTPIERRKGAWLCVDPKEEYK